jgi:hypothetical protein
MAAVNLGLWQLYCCKLALNVEGARIRPYCKASRLILRCRRSLQVKCVFNTVLSVFC